MSSLYIPYQYDTNSVCVTLTWIIHTRVPDISSGMPIYQHPLYWFELDWRHISALSSVAFDLRPFVGGERDAAGNHFWASFSGLVRYQPFMFILVTWRENKPSGTWITEMYRCANETWKYISWDCEISAIWNIQFLCGQLFRLLSRYLPQCVCCVSWKYGIE